MTCVKRCYFVDKTAPTGEEEDEKQERTEEVGQKMTRERVGVEVAKLGASAKLQLVFNVNSPTVGVVAGAGWQSAALFHSLCN